MSNCTGSYRTRTACGMCERCAAERQANYGRDLSELTRISSEGGGCRTGQPRLGWICPKCGRGNAPFSPTCPCTPESLGE